MQHRHWKGRLNCIQNDGQDYVSPHSGRSLRFFTNTAHLKTPPARDFGRSPNQRVRGEEARELNALGLNGGETLGNGGGDGVFRS
jgi:hypothetical protein